MARGNERDQRVMRGSQQVVVSAKPDDRAVKAVDFGAAADRDVLEHGRAVRRAAAKTLVVSFTFGVGLELSPSFWRCREEFVP